MTHFITRPVSFWPLKNGTHANTAADWCPIRYLLIRSPSKQIFHFKIKFISFNIDTFDYWRNINSLTWALKFGDSGMAEQAQFIICRNYFSSKSLWKRLPSTTSSELISQDTEYWLSPVRFGISLPKATDENKEGKLYFWSCSVSKRGVVMVEAGPLKSKVWKWLTVTIKKKT